MVAVWRKVRELNEAGCKDWEKLYEDVAETFHIGRGRGEGILRGNAEVHGRTRVCHMYGIGSQTRP